MEIRAIAPNEWKYTYSQSMQLEGQTGNIGHLLAWMWGNM